MACLSLAFWEAIAVWVVVIIAVVALLRLLISALSGGGVAFWPPVRAPDSADSGTKFLCVPLLWQFLHL